MPEHLLFHLVFACQILLVSFYLPRKILGRMQYLFDTYPPSTHPKLYPRSSEFYEARRRQYRILNWIILALGLAILGVLLGYSRSGKWDHVIALWYFLLQCLPLMLLDLSSLTESKLMRVLNAQTTRRAELRPRRLLDFVSPRMIGMVIATNVAFAVLIIYVKQFDYPWFGGYWNLVIVTLTNLCGAVVIHRSIYGKKLNPHQAPEDRTLYVETMANIFVSVSIGATLFIALNIILAALELRSFQPAAQSLYFQLLAVVSFRAYRIDYTNFDVYKEDPLAVQ